MAPTAGIKRDRMHLRLDAKTKQKLARAAAYAETGQFDKAVATQKEAIAALTTEQNKKPLESRLKLYEAKTPCRDSETFD